jgi:hypothetical protein
MTLRVPRILAFAIILFAWQVAIGFAFGGDAALDDAQRISAYFAERAVDAVVTFTVFAIFARGLSQAHHISAALVVVLAEVGTFALLLLFEVPTANSVSWTFNLEWGIFLAAVVIGTEVGRRLPAAKHIGTP